MLVLMRRVGETIKINDDISVMIVAIHGDKVRVGVSAPRDVAVHRGEIYDKIQREKQGES